MSTALTDQIHGLIEPFNKKGVELTDATTFAGDLEWDSLTVMDFVDEVEDSRPEEHTPELQSLMRISYAVLCLKKKITQDNTISTARKLTSSRREQQIIR